MKHWCAEMIFHDLERLIDPFLNGHGRHDDDELCETIAAAEFKDRPQINVGLPRTGLHFHGEVARS